MLYYKKDLLGWRYGQDFNRPSMIEYSHYLLSNLDIEADRVVLLSDAILPVGRVASRLMYVSDVEEPVIVIHEAWLRTPLMYASLIEHEKVHLSQYRLGKIGWYDGGGSFHHNGKVISDDVLSSKSAHLLEFEVPAYSRQRDFLSKHLPDIRISDLIS